MGFGHQRFSAKIFVRLSGGLWLKKSLNIWVTPKELVLICVFCRILLEASISTSCPFGNTVFFACGTGAFFAIARSAALIFAYQLLLQPAVSNNLQGHA